jgi:hypothetical protein
MAYALNIQRAFLTPFLTLNENEIEFYIENLMLTSPINLLRVAAAVPLPPGHESCPWSSGIGLCSPLSFAETLHLSMGQNKILFEPVISPNRSVTFDCHVGCPLMLYPNLVLIW